VNVSSNESQANQKGMQTEGADSKEFEREKGGLRKSKTPPRNSPLGRLNLVRTDRGSGAGFG
jgi:hypothetical protein